MISYKVLLEMLFECEGTRGQKRVVHINGEFVFAGGDFMILGKNVCPYLGKINKLPVE